MRQKVVCLLIVLGAGYIAYLAISNAPVRLHLAVASIWFPSLIVLFWLAWNQVLKKMHKTLLITLTLVASSVLLTLATSSVVGKAYPSLQMCVANAVALLAASVVVGILVRLLQALLAAGRLSDGELG